MSNSANSGKRVNNNVIKLIKPYSYSGTWVFDDEKTGLIKEPFVGGSDEIIDFMVQELKRPEDGFSLIFSENPFPNFNLELNRLREEFGGWWYASNKLQMEGWLCPALFLYFEEAPLRLYVLFKSID
tara:strand:- start:1094 stop:1474 length:381 start_codon:yes stop_codon:yes gene_type:complete